MSKDLYEWIEPYDEDAQTTLICRMTAEECIEAQKRSAAKKGHTYLNDQQALDDFCAVHWAMRVKSLPITRDQLYNSIAAYQEIFNKKGSERAAMQAALETYRQSKE